MKHSNHNQITKLIKLPGKTKTRNQVLCTNSKSNHTIPDKNSNFRHIQSEVTATLSAFKNERIKQVNAIDKMRNQLKSLAITTKSIITPIKIQPDLNENGNYAVTLILNNKANKDIHNSISLLKDDIYVNAELIEENKILRKRMKQLENEV